MRGESILRALHRTLLGSGDLFSAFDVVRMLEQYLGNEIFREGVRDYLRTHRFANADTGDLWSALGRGIRACLRSAVANA